jgi:ribosomal protein S18 acetylase RimI-like enzyme
VFRLSARADPAFLGEMLYEAVYWHDDSAEERPPLNELLMRPETGRYVAQWGRPGDLVVLALDGRDEPVGAAWCRHFTAAEPGYGYLADDIPELAIALFPEFRRQRVGSLLLGALLARARAQGDQAISLSVHRDNPARRLYARYGFEVVAQPDNTLTMRVELM